MHEEESFEKTLEVVGFPENLPSDIFYVVCKELSDRFASEGFQFQAGKHQGQFVLQIYGDAAIILDVLSFLDGWLACWSAYPVIEEVETDSNEVEI